MDVRGSWRLVEHHGVFVDQERSDKSPDTRAIPVSGTIEWRPQRVAQARGWSEGSLVMFEAVINAVHRAASGAAIAFNTRPEDSAAAVARWLEAD